ncbi:MAG: EamA family transporter [Candidatus Taylorbacteria bacterium CG11_big_fil_rev_8_21_14_0_20_46_11]|uniref:EamA family transporter n=1 Tax=Candidatus Taylorbacteria bacterium CG11_big_fil_rev_8_21_14_0_20_46_11 TaxID=1975025 RepID=A0A2H0KBP7_9BACT|nr:MAG: EamA family transporter [Candidatus Taylorbacteria bacterium CG11_big_fil_rev_8_21_14_0_20_46_11]
MQPEKTRLDKWAPFLIFIAAMLWASDGPFRYHLTQDLSAGFIVLVEHFINSLIVLPFVILGWKEIRGLRWREWLTLIGIGIGASALATILFTASFSYINPSAAIVLQKLQPLIAIALAVIFLREKTGKRFWIWATLALVGGYIVSFPGIIPTVYEGEVWSPNTIGVLCALGAAILWGAGTVMGRSVLRTVSFRTVTAMRLLIAFVFLMVWNTPENIADSITSLTSKDVLFLIIVSLVSGVLSLLLYYHGLSRTKASVASIAELGFPFLAVIINTATLHVFLEPMQIVGMILLVLAVWKLTQVKKTDIIPPSISNNS